MYYFTIFKGLYNENYIISNTTDEYWWTIWIHYLWSSVLLPALLCSQLEVKIVSFWIFTFCLFPSWVMLFYRSDFYINHVLLIIAFHTLARTSVAYQILILSFFLKDWTLILLGVAEHLVKKQTKNWTKQQQKPTHPGFSWG